MNMRIARLTLSLAAAASLAGLHAQDDAVMKAMRDEMARSMKQLTLENLEKPYFIGYRVVDSDSSRVAASFGALNQSNSSRERMVTVEVRVGDYKLDNSHFFSFNMDQGTTLSIFNGTTSLTVEDDYKELRRQLWLATDSTYKKAVEDLSKKRAWLQNRTPSDDSADFSKEKPVTSSSELPPAKIDLPKWENEARALSAIFRQMPAIQTSSLSFGVNNSYTRYLTSEGTSYTRREPTVTFNASAATQASDGTALDDFVWFHGRSPAEIPSQDQGDHPEHAGNGQQRQQPGRESLSRPRGRPRAPRFPDRGRQPSDWRISGVPPGRAIQNGRRWDALPRGPSHR